MGPLRPVELREWESRVLPDVVLSDADRLLAERLRGDAGGKLALTELRSGLQVAAKSWVGVVGFESLEIRVVPKLAGENLGLVRMIEFTSGLDTLRNIPPARLLDVRGDSLLDLVVLLLVEASEGILRGGLLKDYVEREEELAVVRGRLLADRQMLRRFGKVDRVLCRFDEHEHDVPENQILTLALGAAYPRVGNEVLRHRTRRTHGIFSEVCDPDSLNLAAARTGIEYHRQNEHYRQAHELAWMVLDALGVEDVLAPGTTRSFAFLIDMNQLFERFVFRLLERVFSDPRYRVRYQRRDRSIVWDEDARRPYSTVVPDVLVEMRGVGGRVRVPVDAKYKKYDESLVSPGDIYQSFLYAYAYGAREEAVGRACVIVHPSSGASPSVQRLSVRAGDGLVAANLLVFSLPIPRALDEAHGRATASVLPLLAGTVEEASAPAFRLRLPV